MSSAAEVGGPSAPGGLGAISSRIAALTVAFTAAW
jgi:hypothetical protein